MAKQPTKAAKPASTTQGGQEAPARTTTATEAPEGEKTEKLEAKAAERDAKAAERDAKQDPDAIDAIQKGLEVRGY